MSAVKISKATDEGDSPPTEPQEQEQKPKAMMTRTEVAKETGMTYDEVRRLTEHGELPARKVGHRVLVSRARLEEWLAGSDADNYMLRPRRARRSRKTS